MKIGEIWKQTDESIEKVRRMFEEEGELDDFIEDADIRVKILEINDDIITYTELTHPYENSTQDYIEEFLEDFERVYDENR